jgi:hypothetical protein
MDTSLRELEAGSWKLEAGSWKLAAQLAAGSLSDIVASL